MMPSAELAAQGWSAQSSGTSNLLIGASFSDAMNGTAVGNSGTIRRTTNGGVTWSAQTSGTSATLWEVVMTDANTGTIVGDGGRIMRTTNGGSSWSTQTSGTSNNLMGVSFVNANTGTAVGASGTIRRTTNGGTSWAAQASGTGDDLWGVHFVDANTGTAVGEEGRIVRTTNGGASWTSQTSGTSSNLWEVFFTDANTGTAVGDGGVIRRTTNGGTTWTGQTSGVGVPLYHLFFTSNTKGTVVGVSGTILRTTDGGTTWASQSSGTSNPLHGVVFIGTNTGWAVGASGTIIHTTSGGVSCPTITVNPASLPNSTVGIAYSQSVTASGGVAPYSLAVTSGTLPAGLSLSPAGLLSGTPTSAGTFSFAITASDDNNCQGNRSYTITVSCPTITLTPATLPNGTALSSYSQTLTASGGLSPYAFTITAGSIPSGMTLSVGGVLSGTPSLPGVSTFTVRATDAQGCTGTRSYSLTIVCPSILVSPSSLPGGMVGSPYSQTIDATGGSSPHTFAVTAGSLPGGMTLSASGVLGGVPTTVGSFSFTVTGTDAQGCTGMRAYIVSVACPTIAVNPSSIPDGTAGTAYSQAITASGGTSPYTYGVSAGALPGGLTLSAAGLLSGTPIAVGSFSFTVTATDAQGCSGPRAYSVSIDCPAIDLSPALVANGTVGSAYSQTISGSGGTAPYTFAVTLGSLPAGLTLSSSGLLSGTPTSAGSSNFTITATDALGCIGTRNYTHTVDCPTIGLSPASVPNGTVGASYSQSISGTGGSAPYTFAVVLGVLPSGLSLSPAGTLSGTPTTVGSFAFTLSATDAFGCAGERSYSINIACPTITLSSLSGGSVGVVYSQTITASNGNEPYTFAVTAGTMPTGLTLSASGVVSGTPTSPGVYGFTVTATDGQGCTGSNSYSLTVVCPVVVLSALPGGTVGTAYSSTISVTGGTTPYTFVQISGTLPAGLTLSGSGVLSGTPTAAGNYTFEVEATDWYGCTGIRSYSLSMDCSPITVSPGSLPNGTVGIGYSQGVSAAGGTSPYSYGLSAGSLPPGLTLSGSGLLSGSPTLDGTYSFTVTATDAYGCTGSTAYVVTIGTCPTITISPSSLANGLVSTPYSATLLASGGTAPHTFAVTAGSLPAGMTLSGGGSLAGTPTASGTYSFTVTATDNIGCTGSRSYSFTICATMTLSSLVDGTVGTAYSQTIVGGGGTLPYSFALISGSLPAGLTLASSGVVSGTPSGSGLFAFTVQATDANGCTGSESYSLTMSCPTITLSPASLPSATSGSGYTQTILASGGSAPYSYSVLSGSLPPGLSLSGVGVLAGTPTLVGSYSFTVHAIDAFGCQGTRAYSSSVDCPAITVAPGSIPNGTVGSAYNQTITASGGSSPYTYTVTSGSLPSGLSLATSGSLFGTPNASGSSSFTITATDAQGCTASQSYTVSIDCPVISLTPASLPNGSFASPYAQTVLGAGGNSPYSFAITFGALPPGISLSGTGVLSGTPSTTGAFSFTVTGTDANGCFGSRSYSLTIGCATIALSPATLPGGVVGSVYSENITAGGGTSPYVFSISSGSLPAGLSLSSSGILSGVPTTVGASGFTVMVTDAEGCTGSRSYSITIGCPTIVIKPFSLPNGTAGTPFLQSLLAVGGTPPYAFSVTAGSLPPGLSLTSGGILSGTPTASGGFSFTVRAIDAQGCLATIVYAMTIDCPAITINPTSLPGGLVGVAYSQTLSGSGGTSPYSFSVTVGSLPPGLSLAVSGALTGTPTAGGNFAFTVRVTDANGCSALQGYTLPIGVVPAFSAPPFELDYGNVLVGVGKLDSVTISNPGTGTLTIYSASSTSGHFQVTPSSASILPGGSRKFFVTFAPASIGAKFGNVLFTHSAAGSPNTTSVVGVGVAPVFSILTSISFGTVYVGSNKVDSVTIMNSGTTTLTISSAVTDNPEYTVSPSGVALAPGASQRFTVTFTPVGIGAEAGNIVFTHDGAATPNYVPLSGTGVVDLVLRKLRDTDGNASTAGDRSSKRWRLAVYKDSVSVGTLIAAADTSELRANLSAAGSYIACEADSGIAWSRINGNLTRYDTIAMTGTMSVSDTFVNFKRNGITVRKFEDLDGNFLTTGDRVAKAWYLAIRRDSATGAPVVSGTSPSITALNLGDGTYYATESDSASWTTIGHLVNGMPSADSSHAVAVSLTDGANIVLDFINARSVYFQTFRTFTPDGLAQKRAIKKKPNSMHFCANFTNNTGGIVNGLIVTFHTNGFSSLVATIESSGQFTTASSVDGRTWEFNGAAIPNGEVVTICGVANRSKTVKVRAWNWVINGVNQAVQPNFTPGNQWPRLPMPNFANLRQEMYSQGGLSATNGLIVGIPRTDSAKKYGWVRLRSSRTMQRSLRDRLGPHSVAGHGFDFFLNGRAFVKEQREVLPTKHNNVLFAELVAFKMGILSSEMGKTTPGLGEFIYDEAPGNSLCGLTLAQIAARVDSALTLWKAAPLYGWDYPLYEQIISKINRAFDGPIDTISFYSKLVLKGTLPLVDVPYLHHNPNSIPARIVPLDRSLEPTAYTLFQNYPNPFNPTTTIEFDLVETAIVTLKVYNVLGQEVATLLDREEVDAGNNVADFDASGFASGVYFYRLQVQQLTDEEGNISGQDFIAVRKMIFVK